MKKFYKKSQAALEFLTTYGWAFLVILIMISTLAYFGILSPSKLLPDRCNFGSEIGCKDFTIVNNGVSLRLKNNAGEPIIIDAISASTDKTPLTCSSTVIGSVWLAGDLKDVPVACDLTNSGLTSGEKGKLLLKLTYHPTRSSTSYSRDVSGELYTLVQGNLIVNALLQNPGFETGDLSGWTNWAGGTTGTTTVTTKSGSYSAIISGSNSYCNNYYVQDIPVTPNSLYSFSGWVKTVNEVGQAGVGIANTGWGAWQNSQLITGTTDWTYVSVQNYNSGSNAVLRFFATVQWCGGPPPGNGPSGTSYFDDLTAAKVG